MKFADIVIENFLSIKEGRVTLGDRGLVLVEGMNLDDPSADSNGAGKSSLADALCWCLYGVTARGVTGDDVIHWEVGKGTRVDVEIIDGDDLYKIRRHRKHKEGKNSLQVFRYTPDGASHDLTKGKDDLTQEVVNRIVGCSYKVFRAAVYAGQEQMPDLPGMTDKALKVLIEEAAGVTLLEKAYEKARLACNEAKAVLDRAANAHAAAVAKRDEIARRIEETQDNAKEWETAREAAVRAHVETARTAVAKAKEIAARPELANKEVLHKALEDEERKIAGVEAEHERLAELGKAVTEVDLKVARLTTEARALKRDAEALKEKIDGLDHQVGCPCATCARPYTAEDIAPAKKSLAEDLRDAVSAFKAKKAELDAALDEQKRAREAFDAFKATMTDVSESNALCVDLRRKLEEIARLERQRDEWVMQARLSKKAAEEERAKENPFEAVFRRLNDEYAAQDKVIIEATAAVAAAEEELKVAEEVVKVFSPSGVRAHILDTVTPFLNDRTSRYLGMLSDGLISATWTTLAKTKSGELKEKFCIEVTKDGAGSFAALSGGQKRKVRIACALALQDLVASRATKPIELFIGDEIDDALDPAGLERLMSILEEKARERGSVFVISHNSLRDWISETITVTLKGGYSTIEALAA